MHRHNKKVSLSVLIWLTTATFTAGYTNALCVYYLKLPLTHHTGNITNIALSMAKNNITNLNHIILAIASFFIGCTISGMLFYKKHVGFSKIFAISNIVYCVFYIAINLIFKNNMLLLITTSFMSGMQNSTLTRYKGITTRTTHMTGYITDAGVNLGRAIRGDTEAFKRFVFFMTNIIMFVLGTFIGVYFINAFWFYAFIISGLLRISSSLFYLLFIHKKDKNQVILKNN